MSWNRLILLGLALAAAATAQAQEAKCPRYHGKSPLVSGVVFDGPPEEKADLMPDISRGKGSHAYASWDVGYLFDQGRSVYLVCRYSGHGDENAVTVKVEKKALHCIYRTHAGGQPAELSCK